MLSLDGEPKKVVIDKKPYVANIQSYFKLSSNASRQYIELLVENGFLKKEAHPGYATAYYPK